LPINPFLALDGFSNYFGKISPSGATKGPRAASHRVEGNTETTMSVLSSRIVRPSDHELIRRFSKKILGVSPKKEVIVKTTQLNGRFGGVVYLDGCEDCIQGFYLGRIVWPTEALVDWLVVPVEPRAQAARLIEAVVGGLRGEFGSIQVAVRSRYSDENNLEFLAALKLAAKGDLTRAPDAPDYYRLPAVVNRAGRASYSSKVASRPR
jgi:hypothetical protein